MIRIAEPQRLDDGPYEHRGRFAAELQNEQGRWYDPTLGVWLNDDAVSFAEDVNHYCYVGNLPEKSSRQTHRKFGRPRSLHPCGTY